MARLSSTMDEPGGVDAGREAVFGALRNAWSWLEVYGYYGAAHSPAWGGSARGRGARELRQRPTALVALRITTGLCSHRQSSLLEKP